jgi:2-polyprenyl-3-methyl-5-hydroxy-6-metoxy-1,4-benzoquinol methylase
MAELVRLAEAFRATLAAARKQCGRDIEWYQNDTLANALAVERLVGSEPQALLDLAGGKPVLDIGCADGELAFFMESLGCRAQAIDNPVTNFNNMLGVRALREQLGSKVEIHSIDIDSQFILPEGEYGFVLMLGLLYHLKNPFYVMEKLSKQSSYCLISTAITEYVPGLYENVAGASLGFLAGVYDVNRDSTNYWFFSDAGFRRLLERANWEIAGYYLVTDEGKSAPGSIGGQRAFCLARSKYVNSGAMVLYGRGWHKPEDSGWRWTERKFAIRVESSIAAAVDEIELSIYVPEIVLATNGAVTLMALANGAPLPEERYTAPGSYTYRRKLPSSTAMGDVRIDFTADPALAPDAADPRERGIVVRSVTPCARQQRRQRL